MERFDEKTPHNTTFGSDDLEKELRATIEQLFKAWNEGDFDTMAEIEGDAIG